MKFRQNIIFTAILILLMLIGTISSVYADDRSYSIPGANIDLFVLDDGTLHVKEVIHYHLIGTFNGVYRNIPLKSYENIKNIQVNVSDAYYNYTIDDQGNEKSIKVFLYADKAKTIPINDRDVYVTYEYDLLHVVKFYNDIAELQYKLWGEEWNVPVGQVNAVTHLKSNNGVKFWLNPPYLSNNSVWNGSNLLVTSTSIPKNNWFELRVTIPLNQFTSLNEGHKMGENGTAAILNIQNSYANWIGFEELLFSILPLLILLTIIYPLFILYQSWGGRFKPKGRFSGNLPENDPPAIVNALCGKGISKNVGDPGIDGFLATIMDLIKRRYILVDHSNNHDYDGLKLKINQNKDVKHLQNFEKEVIDFLKQFERNRIIYLDDMSKNLEKAHFQKRFSNWRKHVIKKLGNGKLKTMFVERTNKYLYIYGFITLLVSIFIIAVTHTNPIPGAFYSFYAGIILFTVSLLSLLMTSKVNGKWTDNGKEYRANWMMYKNHIKNSKHYNKDSRENFDNSLIYGTALGVGDNVTKLLGKTFHREELSNIPLFIFQNSEEYKYFRTTLISYMGAYGAMQAYIINTGDGGFGGLGGGGAGGAGGAGGGSGGGGGGAF